MTLTEMGLRAIGKFPVLKKPAQSVCRYVVGKKRPRKYLNNFYNRLSYKERIFFHYVFGRIFRNGKTPDIQDVWKVKFCNKTVLLPLRKENLWLDWNLAISIVGHDVEIKSFYEQLLNSKHRPAVFFDIGANYGTHSILFLSQGIRTITFEPNPECKAMFEAMLHANGLKGQLENYALGESASKADLVFPKTDTWNGSLETDYQKEITAGEDVVRITVEVITLDDYVANKEVLPGLIKIDTEGFELHVLKGARNTLLKSKPVIVFETNRSAERKELFREFKSLDYSLYDMDDKFFKQPVSLSQEAFLDSSKTNFIAAAKTMISN